MDGFGPSEQLGNAFQWQYLAIRNFSLLPTGEVMLELYESAVSAVTTSTVDMVFLIAVSYWTHIFVSNGQGGWKCPGLNETLDKRQLKERIENTIVQYLLKDPSFEAAAETAYLVAEYNVRWDLPPAPASVWPVGAERIINDMSFADLQTSLRSETASKADSHDSPLTFITLGNVDAQSAIVSSSGATESTWQRGPFAYLLPP